MRRKPPDYSHTRLVSLGSMASKNPDSNTPVGAAQRSDESVWHALQGVVDPELRRPLTELDMVDSVTVTDDHIQVTIALTIVGCPASDRIHRETLQAVEAVAEGRAVDVELTVMDAKRRSRLIESLRGGRGNSHPFGPDTLTRILAITSGKGGVGKSSITANLAALAVQSGLRVGIIDADVFGFSQPGLMGLEGEKPTRLDDMILPPIGHDVKVMSIGMFVEPGVPVSWRGPMLHRTITQFLSDVYFGDLDLLLLDLPPGTGDVAISVGQLLPHSDVVVVTTPQKSAADVAIRSGLVARQTGQRVVGVVETMSGGNLPDGTPFDLFGSGGGESVAESLEVPLLGSIPLSVALREGGDRGVPIVLAHPDDPAAIALGQTLEAIQQTRRPLQGVKLPVRAN